MFCFPAFEKRKRERIEAIEERGKTQNSTSTNEIKKPLLLLHTPSSLSLSLFLNSCLAETTNPYLWAGYTGNDFLPNHAADGEFGVWSFGTL